ncbi:hypothetical protein [Bacillus pseudomycoides]|uniref:hypothetical protein n=1 Tax=Bacillus pseudomycoides TaxID=64104 RepID=UPI000BFD4CFE|nr:hypothetical protein [Bacillus pseudomycoides]PHE58685.1 hypothetical protein COF52_03525 [Bacillus pseudomycoides]
MKTILAIVGLIWVMSHGVPIFEGEQIRIALNQHFDEYHIVDRKDNIVTLRVKDCFHTAMIQGNTVMNDTKVCDQK